jgi:hypothetical protein
MNSLTLTSDADRAVAECEVCIESAGGAAVFVFEVVVLFFFAGTFLVGAFFVAGRDAVALAVVVDWAQAGATRPAASTVSSVEIMMRRRGISISMQAVE